jgi:DNA/RNA-binding domain of Phe-tRNA-synthetase-like protein
VDTREQILSRDYSQEFDKGRQDRIVQSWYKYGYASENYPTGLASAIGSLYKRLELYKQTGNREYLMDIANFAMIEYMYPQHPNAHYRVVPSEESPGLDGISAKELMEK